MTKATMTKELIKREEKRSKQFSIELMKILGLKLALPCFRKGQVLKSYVFGNLRPLEEEEEATIKMIEDKYDMKTYHVVHALYNLGGTNVEMLHYLVVEKNLFQDFLDMGFETVEEIEEGIKINYENFLTFALDGVVMTYTVNKTMDIEEFVDVWFEEYYGGIVPGGIVPLI